MDDEDNTLALEREDPRQAIALFDASDRLIACNALLKALVGDERAGWLIGKSAKDVLASFEAIDAADAERLHERWNPWRGRDTEGAGWLKTSDGHTLEVHRHDLQDGQHLLVLVDETARLETLDALESESMRLTALLDHAPALISSKDLRGRVTSMNARFELFFDDHEAMIGQSVFDLFPPETAETLWANDLQAQHGPIQCDELVTHRDGKVRTYDTIKFPLRDRLGQLTGTGAISTDITERLRAEEERDALQAQLTHAQRLESVGMLAGGIAHDFNNLLAVIYGGLEMSQRTLRQAGLDTAALENARQAARRAADLVKQLLTYAGKNRVELLPLDLNEAVRGVAQLCEASLSKKVSLTLDLQSAQLPVEANGGQVGQVLLNLVTNAAEAIDKGEGRISVRTEKVVCDTKTLARLRPDEPLPPGEYAVLEVRDDGPGMDEATLARVFDPFFSTRYSGRGLGLAIVHGAVRGHGGAIDVTSAPGDGTRFRVYLPVTGKPLHGAEGKQAQAGSPQDDRRGLVLVVDDEPIVQKTTATMAHALGFDVVVASDGSDAVDQVRLLHGRVDVIVMDLHMPRMDGAEALQRLTAEGHTIPCILASGNASDLGSDFDAAGFASRLDKPFTLRQLESALMEVLGR